ncbi:MAG: hypothetical protein DWQ07_02695 [Chloroflexi bacterium]|nr:MAG: hypothetical protein DWQ07_02695 [Chloroflexota bacterium]MBL1193592.1 hypothetical protein [Chloroflexota bacterium]
MKLSASLQRKEIVWVLFAIILILLLSSIPYIVGYQLETDTKVFGGAFFDRQDVAVHMASMQAGRQGGWLYHFRFSSEEHQGYPVKMFYILLGQLGRIIPYRSLYSFRRDGFLAIHPHLGRNG